jgi:hypothetical protein
MRNLKYTEYRKLQSAFEKFTPENESEQIIHRFVWDVLRQGYEVEELTKGETHKLFAKTAACEPVEFSDEIMHGFGPHRELYDFITSELNLTVEPKRGHVYRRATLLLEKNAHRVIGKLLVQKREGSVQV